ncbi:MAG: hypothetical protein ACRCUY_11130 [Thermoguttaceae bacterium]
MTIHSTELRGVASTGSFAEVWKERAAALRAVWEAELQSPDYEKRLANFGETLNWACKNSPPRTTSGLVTQQYYFRKFYREHFSSEKLSEIDFLDKSFNEKRFLEKKLKLEEDKNETTLKNG